MLIARYSAVLTAVALIVVSLCFFNWPASRAEAASRPDSAMIRIGILHSQSGAMAISEQPVINATLLAIEEINAQGGLLGRKVEAVIADGKSDEEVFANQAARLISQEGVDVIFGCWTSASRKAVLPVVESLDHLLIYPVQYEGLENSEHIIYTGSVPNQQIMPAVSWALGKLGKRVYLVGSDYIFPHVANWLIKQQISLLGGSVAGERYVPLEINDDPDAAGAVVADILKSHADLILNTINGRGNIDLFHAMKQAGISAAQIPVLSFSLSEVGISRMPADEVTGHYAAWSYFQSLKNAPNRAFVAAYQHRFGNLPVSDPMQAAWAGVQLWANAVRHAGTSDPRVIRHSIRHQSLPAPEGIVSVDQNSGHLWKIARIGRINSQRQLEQVWQSDHAIKPLPYPIFIERDAARALLDRLYFGWGSRWSAPPIGAEPVKP